MTRQTNKDAVTGPSLPPTPSGTPSLTGSRRRLIGTAVAVAGATLVTGTRTASAQLFGGNKKPEFKRLGKNNMLAGRSFKGKKAPEITFEKWVANAPSSTAGKPVLLKFFATTCPVCMASVRTLNRLHREIGDRITIIALSNERSRYLKKVFVEPYEVRYPVATDTGKRLFNTYQMTEAYPHYVVIDARGIVRYEGIMPYTQYERMRDRILQKARI